MAEIETAGVGAGVAPASDFASFMGLLGETQSAVDASKAEIEEKTGFIVAQLTQAPEASPSLDFPLSAEIQKLAGAQITSLSEFSIEMIESLPSD